MTNINCTLDCKHQKDGKCMLDNAEEAGTITESCFYFSQNTKKKKTT